MIKSSILFSVLLLCTGAFASTSIVTATVQDPNGQIFAYGSVKATFVPAQYPGPYTVNGSPFPMTVSGSMDNTGTFSITITNNISIQPAKSQWMFSVCPVASVKQCSSLTLPITTGTANITTPLNAVVLSIQVDASPQIAYAYTESEIIGQAAGSTFFNILAASPEWWNPITLAWVVGGGGGGSGCSPAAPPGDILFVGPSSNCVGDSNFVINSGTHTATLNTVQGVTITDTGAGTFGTSALAHGAVASEGQVPNGTNGLPACQAGADGWWFDAADHCMKVCNNGQAGVCVSTGSGTPGLPVGSMQGNNAGMFFGLANFTFSAADSSGAVYTVKPNSTANDTIILQRKAGDSGGQTGFYFIRGLSADGSTNIFTLDTIGNMQLLNGALTAHGIISRQAANTVGLPAISAYRNTDTSPVGYYYVGYNSTGSNILYSVDVLGNISGNTVTVGSATIQSTANPGNSVTFLAPNTSFTSWFFPLPVNQGSFGSCLLSSGSPIIPDMWGSCGTGTPGGATNSLQFNNGSGGFAGATHIFLSDLTTTLTVGNNTQGTINAWEINSNQICTLGSGFMNLCRGDTVSWAAWGGTGQDTWGINSSDRPTWNSAVTINGATTNQGALLSDLIHLVSGPNSSTIGNAPSYNNTTGNGVIDSGLGTTGLSYDSGDLTVAMVTGMTPGCIGTTPIPVPAAATHEACWMDISQTVADSGCSTHAAISGQLSYTDNWSTVSVGGANNLSTSTVNGGATVNTQGMNQTLSMSTVWSGIERHFFYAAGTTVSWCNNLVTAPVGCATYPTVKLRVRCVQE